MTTAHKIEFESGTLFLFAAAFGIIVALYSNHVPNNKTVYHLPVQTFLPTPTDVPVIPKVSNFSQVSPDGKKEVRMNATTNANGSQTYEVTAFDTTTNVGTLLQTITFTNDSLSLPFNAWSPDDKYVFIQHNTKSGTESWVFRGNGQPITENEPFYNGYNIFLAKNTGNNYQETTGWASETLLIINSTTPGGDRQSYWLEVPSKAVIALSTQF